MKTSRRKIREFTTKYFVQPRLAEDEIVAQLSGTYRRDRQIGGRAPVYGLESIIDFNENGIDVVIDLVVANSAYPKKVDVSSRPKDIRRALKLDEPGASKPETPCFDRDRGEIRVTHWDSINRLQDLADRKINTYCYIDDVEMRTDAATGGFTTARYIRFQPHLDFDPLDHDGVGHGGALLPLVAEDGGWVLLVSQWRHNRRRTMVEIPRGFGDAGERAKESAIREGKEEVGAVSVRRVLVAVGAHECEFPLGQSTTDSGKLAEAPASVLSFINYDRTWRGLETMKVGIENPVFVRLKPFFRAVFDPHGVSLQPDDIRRVPSIDRHFSPCADIDQGHLRLTDNFTLIAGLRAWHLLQSNYPVVGPMPEWVRDIAYNRLFAD